MVAEAVVLRPVQERDLVELQRIDTDPSVGAPFEWHGFRDPNVRRRRWEQDNLLGDDDAVLVVSVDGGTFAGIVVWSWVAVRGPRVCMRVGILLLPEYRSRGIGTAAQRLLADYLFETTVVHRIEAVTEADNAAEQHSLEKSGFVREGIMRENGFARGALRDSVLYSRLRSDPAPD